MKKKEELNISGIHKNWLSIQTLKLANREPDNHMFLNKLPKTKLTITPKKTKIQSEDCYFHVYIKGHNSYTIFYDNEDRVHFLLILDEEVKKREARISAFTLMDNHIHLQIITSQLSPLIRITLSRYSRRIKYKYGMEGPIFKKSFGKSQIFSYLIAKENLLYILSNASRDNICSTHRDYIWSSYNSHPEVIHLRSIGIIPLLRTSIQKEIDRQNSLPVLKRKRGALPSKTKIAKTDISQIITVDVSFMTRSFQNLKDLDNSIHSYVPLYRQLTNLSVHDDHKHSEPDHSGRKHNGIHNNRFIKLTPDSEIASFFIKLLHGRKFNSITANELAQIAHKLKREKNATKRQISNIMRM